MTNVDVFAGIRSWAPKELLGLLDQIVVLFSDGLKYNLKQVIDAIPAGGDNLAKVLELVRSQWRDLRSSECIRIAVTGPAQAGKSEIVRALSRRQTGPCRSLFSVVDAQGLDEYLGYGRDHPWRQELLKADILLLVLDGCLGVSDSTVQMCERLRTLGRPILIVLNKMDLVADPGGALRAAKRQLRASTVPMSVLDNDRVIGLLKAIVAGNPRALYPLTRNFPEFRRHICKGIVNQASLAAGAAGVFPIPVASFLPLAAIQSAMVLKIAHAYGFRLETERVRELLPVLLTSLLVQGGRQALQRRYPAQSALIGAAANGVSTLAVGRAALQYFDRLTPALDSLDPR